MDGVEKSRVKHTETKTDIYDIQDNTNPNNQRAVPNQQPQRPSSNNPYDNSYQPE